MCIYTYDVVKRKVTKRASEAAERLVTALNSKVFKALSEPVRAEILKYLLLNGRADIGTIAEKLPQDRSVISRHLSLMADAGILFAEKEARHMFYSINAEAFLHEFEGIIDNIRACMCYCCRSEEKCR